MNDVVLQGNALLFRNFKDGDKVEKVEFKNKKGHGGRINATEITIPHSGKYLLDTGLNVEEGFTFSWEGVNVAGADIKGSLGPVVIKTVTNTVTAPAPKPVVNTVNVPNPVNGKLLGSTIGLAILVLCLGIGLYFAVNNAKSAVPAATPVVTAPADPIAVKTAEVTADVEKLVNSSSELDELQAKKKAADTRRAAIKGAAGL